MPLPEQPSEAAEVPQHAQAAQPAEAIEPTGARSAEPQQRSISDSWPELAGQLSPSPQAVAIYAQTVVAGTIGTQVVGEGAARSATGR